MAQICAACGTRTHRKFPGWCEKCGLDNAWVDDLGIAPAAHGLAPQGEGFVRADAFDVRPVTRMHSGGPLDTVLGGGIPTGAAVLLWGRSGSGKTRVALQIAHRVHPVALVNLEMVADDVTKTLAALQIPPAHVWVSREPNWRPLVARTPERPRAVIIDSLNAINCDPEREMRATYDWCHATGITALAICHATVDGKAKGGSGPTHWSDAAVIVRAKGRGRITVDTPAKNRYASTGPGRPIGRGSIV